MISAVELKKPPGAPKPGAAPLVPEMLIGPNGEQIFFHPHYPNKKSTTCGTCKHIIPVRPFVFGQKLTKKQLEELDSKIDANEKESVQSLITKLETAIQNEDTNSMKSLTEEVKQVMMEIGQKVYSQTDTPDQNPSATDSIETDFSVGK